MDTKNVIAAISLSAAVIILYGLFFAPPPQDPKLTQKKDIGIFSDQVLDLFPIK